MLQNRDPSPATSKSQGLTGPRLWLYRLLALVAVPALLLVALEIGLRVCGYGRATGFMIPDAKEGFYRTNQSYVRLFMPETFDLRPLNFRVARQKQQNTVRVVVLGESAAQGVPAPQFGFAPQLRALLRARYPGTQIEVLNTGIVAINSHVVYQIARDMAAFSPDLFVVYVGNNEVVGPYAPGCTYLPGTPPLWAIRSSVALRSTRTGQLLASVLGRIFRKSQPSQWDGMSMFAEQAVAGDDPRLQAVYRNFETNLRDTVRVAEGAGAKVVLCTVVANLKDCPPFLSLHRQGLTGDELARWQTAFDRGRLEWLLSRYSTARSYLEDARNIDPDYADTLYMLGDIELHAGNESAARALFVDALHWDALRFRPDPRINGIIRDVAATDGSITLADTARMLGSDEKSTAPISGREVLFEHVHLDWEGNQRVARAIAEGIEKSLKLARPDAPAWLAPADCAAAVGYTSHERATVLEKLAPIVSSPPFTNQLTYPEDMVRLDREIAREKAVAHDPETLKNAREIVAAAVARDPENADLAKTEEEIADDLGDLPAMLAAARRARELQPDIYATAGDVAITLLRLGREREAGELLRQSAAAYPLREQILLAPAFIDLFARTNQPDENLNFLNGLIAQKPEDESLLLLRARTLRVLKHNPTAERDYRAILERDPGNPDALEGLLSLLKETGRPDEAERLSLAFAGRQPRNQANNARAAAISDTHGDVESHIRFLLASERSGEITSAVEIRLARLLFARDRKVESLTHLGYARRISLVERDSATTASIDELVNQLLPELGVQ